MPSDARTAEKGGYSKQQKVKGTGEIAGPLSFRKVAENPVIDDPLRSWHLSGYVPVQKGLAGVKMRKKGGYGKKVKKILDSLHDFAYIHRMLIMNPVTLKRARKAAWHLTAVAEGGFY